MTDDKTTDKYEIETSDTSLTIRRTFDVSPERVFEAWTDPEQLAEWYAPGDMTPLIHTVNPEPGGEFSVSFLDDENRIDIEGTFVEVVENERLVYNDRFFYDPDEVESRVTIELEEVDGGTEVVLTHERLPDDETGESAAGGWPITLDKLEAMLKERKES